jgi:ABC-type transporter MlaC component
MKIVITLWLLLNATLASAYSNNTQQQSEWSTQSAIYKTIYKINQFSGSKYPKHIMHKFVDSEILPLFDFDTMSMQVLAYTPAHLQKPELINRIKKDIANTLIQSLLKARGKVFIPVGVRKIGDSVILKVRVKNIVIDLLMHQVKHDWKIFDVRMQNQSLVEYYKKLLIRQ